MAIDQSTASRRLTALEEAVGARLVLRGGRELGWTEQGRIALCAAEAVDAAITGFIVFHEAARDSTRVRVVVDAMQAYFDAHQDQLARKTNEGMLHGPDSFQTG